MQIKTQLLAAILITLPTMTGQVQPTVSTMLEQRLRGVVTVEVLEASSSPRAFFGVAAANPTAPAVNPYVHSVYLTKGEQSGSGFVIRRGAASYVVTNAHVIEESADDSVEVISVSGERYEMKIVGADTIRDLAVLAFKTTPGAELVSLAFKPAPLHVGERVFALGNPGGSLPSTVTDGIISGLNRQFGSATAGYLQTTARLSHGNSGGPLINEQGAVVGVNTFIGAQDSMSHHGFSMNAALAESTVDQIIKNGRVRRGSLGLQISALDIVERFQISRVASDVPEPIRTQLIGRNITQVNGVAIRHSLEMFGVLDQLQPGSTVRLRVEEKDGKPNEVVMTATELTEQRLAELTGEYMRDVLGISVTPGKETVTVRFTAGDLVKARYLRVTDGLKNAEVLKVPPTFVAVAAGRATEDGSTLYPISDLRGFQMMVRRFALDGQFSLVALGPAESVDVLHLSTQVLSLPLLTILN